MKVTKFKQDIQELDRNALVEKLTKLKRDLFSLRLNATTAHVKDYSQYKKLRKNIARVYSCFGQKSVALKNDV